MNTKENTNTSEEIDLGQLFKLIGNAINAFFNRIAIILKTIYHCFMSCALFFRDHFFKWCTAAILGIGIGAYLDYNAEPLYRSSMIVEPNFNSDQQLYNNIQYYNKLILLEDNKKNELAKALNIPLFLAKSINSISIEAVTNEIEQLKRFNEFVQDLDSLALQEVQYEEYLKNFNDLNARLHKIQIEATLPETAKECQEVIVNAIQNNEYFKAKKEANDDNIIITDYMISEQQKEINNLQVFYKKIKMLEAKTQELNNKAATNINLTDNNSTNKELISEIELFNQLRQLKSEKIILNKEKVQTRNIINIISEFSNKGVLINDFWYKKIVQIPVLFVTVLFLILIMFKFNKYLKNYSSNKNLKKYNLSLVSS